MFKYYCSSCMLIFAIFAAFMLDRLDHFAVLEEVGTEKCLHLVHNVPGAEDFAKLDDNLIISSNNYL